MKIKILLLFLYFLSVFSCKFPNEIELRTSTPPLKFAVDMNISEILLNMIKDNLDSDSKYEKALLKCSKPETQTYLLQMIPFNETMNIKELIEVSDDSYAQIIDLLKGMPDNFGGFYFMHTVLYDSDKVDGPPLILELANLGDKLSGLNFNSDEVKTKLFFNIDKSFATGLIIEIEFYVVDGNVESSEPMLKISVPEKNGFDKIDIGSSGINTKNNVYDYYDLPEGGSIIEGFGDLLNLKKDLKVRVKVIMPDYTLVAKQDLYDPNINVSAEIVVWLPMDFIVAADTEITFPEDSFNGAGEYIESITNVLERISVAVEMSGNLLSSGGGGVN